MVSVSAAIRKKIYFITTAPPNILAHVRPGEEWKMMEWVVAIAQTLTTNLTLALDTVSALVLRQLARSALMESKNGGILKPASVCATLGKK